MLIGRLVHATSDMWFYDMVKREHSQVDRRRRFWFEVAEMSVLVVVGRFLRERIRS